MEFLDPWEAEKQRKTHRSFFLFTLQFDGISIFILGRIYEKLWKDNQCQNIDEVIQPANEKEMPKKFVECRKKCLENDRCTAVNFCEDRAGESDCILRACNVPIPKPEWERSKCKGYIIEGRERLQKRNNFLSLPPPQYVILVVEPIFNWLHIY